MTPRSSSSRDATTTTAARCGNTKNSIWLVVTLAAAVCTAVVHGFSNPNLARTSSLTGENLEKQAQRRRPQQQQPLFMSSFSADGSEYSSKDSDYDTDEMEAQKYEGEYKESDDDEVETVEQQPVPMSKNAGNRFVALYWDHELERNRNEGDPRESWWLHYDRDDLNEDHVMYCRKRNLYNETFNQDSMVDVMRSLPILASDLKRIIGHCMVLESTDLKHVKDLLREDPILKSLTDGGERVDEVPLYRWRHIRDYSLRQDDGRFGFPCLMIGLDDDPEVIGNDLRPETEKPLLEYLINSQKVIAGGPLHLPTEFKDDPSSIAVGDLIMFNAKDREDAISFVENLPSSQAGLYKDLRVHFYNQLDVTGKFVSEDPNRDAPGYQMKEAMEYWGYPVEDEQTPWLNW
mmetsp:Transcript_26382/g.61972  ORF Transcript_26382/g.61972 Transcript_26382/m.61972 type:complete len:404 (-) Transcript_26382:303-1514(-)|eukprot:CAMPEP_0197173752 /NCGR_PEP_ID=MMETSP1423-20130617/560_1 /TAXON_ID=476441 /ORGANISM="Pseudo-nitzschia heimii, Strain UNC1101" /LENGTH=403 /DNA_ID=CAMNT_0042622607 /DNA_START=126 /DNA_END=1337 /DNA_ORIENTATION=-